MKHFLFFVMLMSCAFAKAQSPQPLVELIEDKQSKRWNLYAQNNSDIEQEAFLLVKGQGFRRSANRPVIKKIPPHSKVLMITLIPLAGVTPTYNTIFTFETNLQTIEKRKGENREEHVNIRPLNPNEVTIFMQEDCDKCDYLLTYLHKKHIKYRKLDLKKNAKVVDLMWNYLKNKIPYSDVVNLPVVMENKKVYHDIVNIKRFAETYDWKIPGE